MRKFNIGDKVRFIEEQHSQDYIRDYSPLIGTTGVIQSFSNVWNEYLVLFEHADATTYCYEGELEPVKSKESICLYCDELEKDKYDLYVKGEWKDMKNEVLELWYVRKHDKIMKEYEEKEREFNNSKELVIKYKEIIENFEKELEELYNCEENIENNYIKDNTLSKSIYKYKINYDKLSNEFVDEYVLERDEKLHELDELREEINAQLSLSSELDYQIEVLTTYGILDKKTKKMVD